MEFEFDFQSRHGEQLEEGVEVTADVNGWLFPGKVLMLYDDRSGGWLRLGAAKRRFVATSPTSGHVY